jgi:hypothetical protein
MKQISSGFDLFQEESDQAGGGIDHVWGSKVIDRVSLRHNLHAKAFRITPSNTGKAIRNE